METQQDEEFGPMTSDGSNWTLERRVLLGAQQVPVEVEAHDDGSFDSMQRAAVRLALALGPDALEEAAPAVVQNYEVYREAIGDEEETPQLERLADVWKMVQISRIRVPVHGEARHAYFLLEAECDWDEEHGLEVRYRDGLPIVANQAGESGGAWDNSPEELEEMRQAIEEANAQFEA